MLTNYRTPTVSSTLTGSALAVHRSAVHVGRMPQERKRRLAAVWFADIVGYTELSSRDEDGALAVVDELQRLAREEVEPRGGRIVKFQGDAVLAVFDSTDSALDSALALQESFSGK